MTTRKAPFSLSLSSIALVVGVGTLAVFILYPVVFTVDSSFWSAEPTFKGGHVTLDNYAMLLGDEATYGTILNTFVQAGSSAGIAIGLGTLLSIITVRTDTPFRRVLFYLPYLPLAFPVLIANQAWIYTFELRAGLLNVLFGRLGLSTSTFNIYSWPGMIFASAMALTPIAYLTVSAAMRNIDTSLEEVSRASGSGVRNTLLRVSIPLMAPSIFSAFLLCFTLSAGSFETPTMIGIPAGINVMMSAVYNNVDAIIPPNYSAASTESVLLLVIIMSMVYLYNRSLRGARRFEVVTGKGYSASRVLSLGSWRYVALVVIVAYLVLALALPLFTITLLSLVPLWLSNNLFGHVSLKNYVFLFSKSSGIYPALLNSVIASVVSATIVIGIALVIVFAAKRTKIRGRGLLEGLGMFPISMPTLVISFGLLWAFLTIPIGIYGTLWVMIIALSVTLLPQGIRSISGGVISIQTELQEAARSSGASMATTIRQIFLPLVRSSLVGAWLYVFIGSFTALGSVLLLQTSNNQLFSTLLWSFWSSGNPGSADSFAAGCVLLLLILVSAISAMVLLQRRLEKGMSS
ncbi:MAG: iron ABC transporter permease [Thaumarchaeota archaeon]|nr:iron ABC transporter permease [Nitrososphaerota archaeon]